MTPAFDSPRAQLMLLIVAIGFNLGAIASVFVFVAALGGADIPGWLLVGLLACWPAKWVTDRIVDSADLP